MTHMEIKTNNGDFTTPTGTRKPDQLDLTACVSPPTAVVSLAGRRLTSPGIFTHDLDQRRARVEPRCPPSRHARRRLMSSQGY